MHVPITREEGKVRRELMEIGSLRGRRLGKASVSSVRAAIQREFLTTGRVVPPWRVQQLCDEIHAKMFAEALIEDQDDGIPF